MDLSKWLKPAVPCLIALANAFGAATAAQVSVEPSQPPVLMQIANPHSAPAAQISYSEYKKRLHEARSNVFIATYEAASFTGHTFISASGPNPAPA